MLREKLAYLSQGAELVVFAGSLPRDVGDDFYADAIHELARRHIPAVLDCEGEALRYGVEAEPFLVSPNQSEAESLVGQEFHDDEDFQLGLDQIAELGARNVIITSEAGCVALLRDGRETRRFRAIAPRVEPVSTVGAGDVLLAAFLAARSPAARPRTRCAPRSAPAPPRRSSSAPAASTRARPSGSRPASRSPSSLRSR